jgi:hypothetical protein
MNRFPFRCITAKNPRFLVATGPEGFEPPTTWLKARRSTELSYEPTPILTKMYSIITMPKNYIKIFSLLSQVYRQYPSGFINKFVYFADALFLSNQGFREQKKNFTEKESASGRSGSRQVPFYLAKPLFLKFYIHLHALDRV